MKYKLKPNKIDILIIPFLIIFALIVSFCVFYIPKDSGKSVSIYIQTKKEYSLDLNVDQTLVLIPGEYNKELNQFPSLQGEMHIEIKNKKIRVEKEESPLHVCSKQGWVSTPNLPVTCAPNEVIIVIESNVAEDIEIPL